MKWTSEPPNEVGWYWYRRNGIEPIVTRVRYVQKTWNREDGERLSCFQPSMDGPALAREPGAMWFGPMEPPSSNPM